MPISRAIPVLLLGLAATAPRAAAQQPVAIPSLHDTTQAQIEVMLLGVFHFHNPNADYAQFRGIDVLTPARQREIEAVAEALARFAPTKIAVEAPPSQTDSLNAHYHRYRAGTFALTRNEIHQLGFRLAAMLGHDRVHPVDYRMGMRLDSLLGWAREHDPAMVQRFDAYIGEIVALLDRMQAEETIAATLRFMNEPENVRRTHEPYAVQATVGEGDNYIGARAVGDWYERNLKIFANLARVAAPGDRVLLIIGAGHTPILRHLVETHPGMRIIEALDYLPQ